MKLFAAGLSHKTAPVELRERLAVNQAELADRARKLKSRGELDEIVLLSTCNRVEIYGTTQRSSSDIKSLFQFLSSEVRELDPYIYLHEDAAAVRHLLRVTAGLDSMVLGETEITGQIKNAYEIARNAGLTGGVLNRLFQRAFQATKEIRTRTGIGRGTVSIKSTAVELIGKTDLSQQSIMVLGAGEMAENCVRLLVKKGAGSILVSKSFVRSRSGPRHPLRRRSDLLWRLPVVRYARCRCCHRGDQQRRDSARSRRRRKFDEGTAQSPAASHRYVRAA